MMKNNFKIAKIIDEYTVIINAGSNHDVEVDDEFQILDKKGSAVKDPSTNEIIGYLDLIKETVTVTEIQEKMCFCTSPKVVKMNHSLLFSLKNINENLSFTEKAKLNIDLSQVTGGLRRSDAPIQIGDSVKLIKTSKK